MPDTYPTPDPVFPFFQAYDLVDALKSLANQLDQTGEHRAQAAARASVNFTGPHADRFTRNIDNLSSRSAELSYSLRMEAARILDACYEAFHVKAATDRVQRAWDLQANREAVGLPAQSPGFGPQ
jgi:hypothetical protein